MATGVVVALSTFESQQAAAGCAEILVGEGLAACVNLVPGVQSIYRWNDKVERSSEVLAIIKTSADRFDAMKSRLVELHSYDVPELIAWPIEAGHPAYLDWVLAETSP